MQQIQELFAGMKKREVYYQVDIPEIPEDLASVLHGRTKYVTLRFIAASLGRSQKEVKKSMDKLVGAGLIDRSNTLYKLSSSGLSSLSPVSSDH